MTLQDWLARKLTPEEFRECLIQFGGARHYLGAWSPKDRPGRDRRIVQDFQALPGGEVERYDILARRYRLSTRTIRRITRGKKLTPAA